MATTTYNVTGMTCGHCANAIREEVGEIDAVTAVEVSHETGVMTVTSNEPVDFSAIIAALEEAGEYAATEV